MAHHLSAKKRIRQSETKRLQNRYGKVTTRNAIRDLRNVTDKNEALANYPKVASMLDKLAKKNVIHKNKASNLKSKLMLHISKLA
jgi:small subunit ribosomal protein S20